MEGISDRIFSSTSAAFWKAGTGNTTLRNNVLLNNSPAQSGVAKHYAVDITAGTFACSHNLLWAPNANGCIGYSGSDRITLSNWKTGTNQDTASLSYFPDLNTNAYLRPNAADTAAWAMNGRGVQVPNDTTDISGAARSTALQTGAADIGAWEFTPTSIPPMATAVPASATAGSQQAFLFGEDTIAKINWNISSGIPSTFAMRMYSGTLPPAVNAATSNYMTAYWDLSAPAGSYLYDLLLYYKDSWRGTNPSEAGMIGASRSGSNPWVSYSSSSVDVSNNFISVFALSDFMVFTGTDNFNPLPVSWLGFNARLVKEMVRLDWQTASETNNDYFTVERSSDGSTFSPVNRVAATGNSRSVQSYHASDNISRLDAGIRTLYYRIRQSDKDGRASLSRVVAINLDRTGAPEITVYPNPNTGSFVVGFNNISSDVITISVTDLMGKEYMKQQVDMNATGNMLSLNLAPGFYTLTATTAEGVAVVSKIAVSK